MSSAGDFIIRCRKRGVQIRCESEDEVTLVGHERDLDELRPALQPQVEEVAKLCTTWLRAVPPRRAEFH